MFWWRNAVCHSLTEYLIQYFRQTNPKSTSGDNTLATKKSPQTGESIVAIVAIAAVAGVAFIAFVNYRKNK